MIRACVASGLLLCAFAWPAPAVLASEPDPCAAVEDFTTSSDPMPRVAAGLRPGGQLEVLAIGSATTAGTPANPGFAERAIRALRAAVPGARISLTVQAARGRTAKEMADGLEEELAHHHYGLVIWQTGTVEASHNISPGEFADALAEGIARVQGSGADLVLVDPQFSRFLRANADLGSYEMALQQAAAVPGVVLFRRYDLMHDWVRDGRLDLERASAAEAPKVSAALQACVGEALAKLILSGAQQAAP